MHLRYPRVLYQVLNEGPDERAWSEGDDAAEEEETERAMREEEWGADYGDDLHGDLVSEDGGQGQNRRWADGLGKEGNGSLALHKESLDVGLEGLEQEAGRALQEVPVEIASMIFEFACTGNDALRTLRSICNTCKSWRNTAQQTTSLWPGITIAPGEIDDITIPDIRLPFDGAFTRVKPIQRRLARYGPMQPLRFDIFIPDATPRSLLYHPAPSLYDAILSKVLAEHAHIQRLRIWTFTRCPRHHEGDITYCMDHIIKMILEHVGNDDHPLLKELDLFEVQDHNGPQRRCSTRADIQNVLPFPNLEILKINGAFARLIPAGAWAGLTELAFTGGGWTIEELMERLAACHRLEKLTIEMPSVPWGQLEPLAMRSLRSLQILSINYLDRLPPLRTPRLRHLKLGGCGHTDVECTWQDLALLLDVRDGIERAELDITCLDVLDINIEGDCLDEMVRRCIGLVQLAVDVRWVQIDTLRLIISYIQQPGSVFAHLLRGFGDNEEVLIDEELKELHRLEFRQPVEDGVRYDPRGLWMIFKPIERVAW